MLTPPLLYLFLIIGDTGADPAGSHSEGGGVQKGWSRGGGDIQKTK